jgi:DNA-binding SARP family transcriptional activator
MHSSSWRQAGSSSRPPALCRGDLLADLDDDWVNDPREQHRRELLELLGRIAEEAESSGDHDAALDRTREQVALDPLSEEAQGKLIQRLAATGDRAGALAAYRAYGTRLRRELGMAPSAAIRALVERVRNGEGRSFREPLSPEDAAGRSDRRRCFVRYPRPPPTWDGSKSTSG